jgi:hypothetical protein
LVQILNPQFVLHQKMFLYLIIFTRLLGNLYFSTKCGDNCILLFCTKQFLMFFNKCGPSAKK